MNRMIILLLLCAIVQTASSQLVSRNYKDKAMSKVLVDLRRASKQYKISFIHNELEDYTVTKSFTQLPIPEAIRECIGYYPITMKVEGDSLIFVEAMVKAEGKLIGRIVDSKNQPVIYANIALLNVGDTAIVNSGVSNENGDFVIPTTEERLRVRISCVGYETLILNCETGNLGTIILKETTEHIGEVVVEGSLHINKQDKEVYIPNHRQRNTANSGISLLENLMIPQLDVNRMTGEVKSLERKPITFAIDEREVGKSEIDQLRPKDVLRVEYIDMPSGKFADKEIVINFVLRHYDYGGFVEARHHSRYIYSTGNNSIQASFDHKKMNYSLLLGSNYKNDRGARDEKEEDLLLIDNPIHLTTVSDYDHIKEWQNYGVLRVRYANKDLSLTGKAGITQTRTPEYSSEDHLAYRGSVTENTTAKSTVSSKNRQIYFSANADWQIDAKQHLNIYSQIDFGRNQYHNTFQESDGFDIESHTKEKTFSLQANITYSNNINKRSSFLLQVLELYDHFNDEYRGTINSEQIATQTETIVFPIYTYKPNDRWWFSVRPLGFDVSSWKTLTNSETYWSSRAAFNVKNQINKNSSLRYSVWLGNSAPWAGGRSEVEQIVNKYIILRGNPELKKTIFFTNQLTYNLSLKNWQMMVFGEYEQLSRMTKMSYTPENGKLIESYYNDGILHNLRLNIQQTLFLLNRNLQLKGGIRLERNIMTGKEGTRINHITYNASAKWHFGDFSLSAFFNSPETILMQTYDETKADYGIFATYGKKGFYAEVGARRMFNRDKSMLTYYHDYDYYKYDSRQIRDANGPWLYMKLTYSLDFGRKSDRQYVEESSNGSSAILHK